MGEVIFHEKRVLDEHHLVELKIQKVRRETDYPEGIRYSLVLIRDGKRILGYDNYERKGHHKHLFGKETPYTFTTADALAITFHTEVAILIGRETP